MTPPIPLPIHSAGPVVSPAVALPQSRRTAPSREYPSEICLAGFSVDSNARRASQLTDRGLRLQASKPRRTRSRSNRPSQYTKIERRSWTAPQSSGWSEYTLALPASHRPGCSASARLRDIKTENAASIAEIACAELKDRAAEKKRAAPAGAKSKKP